jgi:hypothetical protein
MKKAVIGVAVVAVVAVGVWVMMNYPPAPAGKATGSIVKPGKADVMQQKLWDELAKQEDNYLDSYAEYFESRPDEPMELLNAFNEVAYNITGHGGLWRKTVPDKYFGCANNEHMPICKKFKQELNSFSKWDKFQDQMNDVGSNREAKKFIKQHHKELEEYLRYYVPVDESFSAVQATPFFSENLASAM